jgi:hypothetical protein
LCQAYVAFLKCSSSWDSAKHSTSPKWLPAITEGLFHFASRVEQSGRDSTILIPLLENVRGLWTTNRYLQQWEPDGTADVFALAIQAGLVSYLGTWIGSLER